MFGCETISNSKDSLFLHLWGRANISMRNGGCLCPSALWRSCSLRIRLGSVIWINSLKFFSLSMSLSNRSKITMSDSNGRHQNWGRGSQPAQENRGQGNVSYVMRNIHSISSSCLLARQPLCELAQKICPSRQLIEHLQIWVFFLYIYFFFPCKIYPQFFFLIAVQM